MLGQMRFRSFVTSLSNELFGKVLAVANATSGGAVETARVLPVTGTILSFTICNMKKANTILVKILRIFCVSPIVMDG